MSNPENLPSPNKLRPIDVEKWHELDEILQSEIELGKELDIDASYVVRDESSNDQTKRELSYQPGRPVYGASEGKLFIAEALRNAQLPPKMRFEWPATLIDTSGKGEFDKAATNENQIFTASAAQTLVAMLSESSNTPVRIVADKFGPAFFNESYEAMGLKARVIPTDNGRFYMWESTAEEMLGSMRRLALPHDPNDPLSIILANSLWSSKGGRHGLLRHVRRSSKLHAATKIGVYDREPIDPEDPNDPYRVKTNVRHDVGIVRDNKGHMISYAICTSTESDEKRKYADWLVAKVGAEVARTVGWTPGLIGRLAMRTVYGRPS